MYSPALDGYAGATAAMNDYLMAPPPPLKVPSPLLPSTLNKTSSSGTVGDYYYMYTKKGVVMEIPYRIMVAVHHTSGEGVDDEEIVVGNTFEHFNKIIETAFDEGKAIFSPFELGSELTKMNCHDYSTSSFSVSQKLHDVLKLSDTLNQLSDGKFDPTVVDYVRWLLLDGSTATDEMRKDRYNSAVGWRKNVELSSGGDSRHITINNLNGRTATSSGGRPTIDLCAVAKGFIVDSVHQVINTPPLQRWIVGSYVEWGGDVRVGGRVPVQTATLTKNMAAKYKRVEVENCTWRPWNVGILPPGVTSHDASRTQNVQDVEELQTASTGSDKLSSCLCISGSSAGRLLPQMSTSITESPISTLQRLPSFSRAFSNDSSDLESTVCHLIDPHSAVTTPDQCLDRKLISASVMCYGTHDTSTPVCAITDGLASCCLIYSSIDEVKEMFSKLFSSNNKTESIRNVIRKVVVVDNEDVEHVIVKDGKLSSGDSEVSTKRLAEAQASTLSDFALQYDVTPAGENTSTTADPRQLLGSKFLQCVSRDIVARTCCLLMMRTGVLKDQFIVQSISSIASVQKHSAIIWLQQNSLAATLVDVASQQPNSFFIVMLRIPTKTRGNDSEEIEVPKGSNPDDPVAWARALIEHFSSSQKVVVPLSDSCSKSASMQDFSTVVTTSLHREVSAQYFLGANPTSSLPACCAATLVLPCELESENNSASHGNSEVKDHKHIVLSWANYKVVSGITSSNSDSCDTTSGHHFSPAISSSPGNDFSPTTVMPSSGLKPRINIPVRETTLTSQSPSTAQRISEGVSTPRGQPGDLPHKHFQQASASGLEDQFGYGCQGRPSDFRLVLRIGKRLCIAHEIVTTQLLPDDNKHEGNIAVGTFGRLSLIFSSGFAALGVFCTSTHDDSTNTISKKVILGASLYNIDLNYRKPCPLLTAMCVKGPLTDSILFGKSTSPGLNDTKIPPVSITVRICLYPARHNKQHNEMAKSQLQWFGDVSGATFVEAQFMYFEPPPPARNLVSLTSLVADQPQLSRGPDNTKTDGFALFSGTYVVDREVVCTAVDCCISSIQLLASSTPDLKGIYLLELTPVKVVANFRASRTQQAVASVQGDFESPGTLFQSYNPLY